MELQRWLRFARVMSGGSRTAGAAALNAIGREVAAAALWPPVLHEILERILRARLRLRTSPQRVSGCVIVLLQQFKELLDLLVLPVIFQVKIEMTNSPRK